MSNQNSFDSSMPQQNDSRLVDLREWYNEKSKEFGSANYQKYKENRNAFLKDSEEYAEYERRLELENESFKQGFADKLKLSLGNYQTKIQRAGNPQWTPIPKAITIESNNETYYCAPAELLKPEDLLAFEESGIDDDISSNSSSEVGTISEYVEADHRLEREVTTLSSESSALFTVNDNRSDQVTAESTHIQKKSESHEKKPDLYPIFNSASNFFKWLQYYSSFLSELQREVQIFEKDQTKKELRMYISRTLATRINDCAKRNCSTSEIAALSNFLVDLFDGKTIENWRGEKFHLEIEDEKQLFYAMVTICDRYLEQIKWDLELMEQIRLVLVMICLKQPIFYKIFCAKVVDSLTLLSFDMDKIISKINSFGKETSQEAASHWINDEQAIFRLFCKVQLAIKSTDEKMAHGIKGPSLLKMIFVETIKSIKPTPLCSAFVLLEITENFKKLIGPQNPEFGVKLTSCYIPQIKESGILDVSSEHLPRRVGEKLDDSAKRIFTSRQDYLCCLLNAALTDLEKKLFTIRK